MNRENLLKLATYLLSGALKADFNMNQYESSGNLDHTNCGTVGCALGHGPYAGIYKRGNEDWADYGARQFISSCNPYLWCFGARWANCDNTAPGAAKRILYLLRNGTPLGYNLFWNAEEFVEIYQNETL
jgi:hypothetical protein